MTQTVQTNGVQPLSKTWELSLYELQRTPQVTLHLSNLTISGAVMHLYGVSFLCVLLNLGLLINTIGGYNGWTGDSCVTQVLA